MRASAWPHPPARRGEVEALSIAPYAPNLGRRDRDRDAVDHSCRGMVVRTAQGRPAGRGSRRAGLVGRVGIPPVVVETYG